MGGRSVWSGILLGGYDLCFRVLETVEVVEVDGEVVGRLYVVCCMSSCMMVVVTRDRQEREIDDRDDQVRSTI